MFDLIYLQVKPGEGGKDSELFAQDLINVYKKHSLRNNLKFSLIQTNSKLIEAKIEGDNCYSYF